ERFLYLPLVGIALAAAAAAGTLAERLAPARSLRLAGAGTAVLGVFVVLVNARHDAWRDDETLWKQTVARNPRSCGAQSAVGGRRSRPGGHAAQARRHRSRPPGPGGGRGGAALPGPDLDRTLRFFDPCLASQATTGKVFCTGTGDGSGWGNALPSPATRAL